MLDFEPNMLLVDAEGYDEVIMRGIDYTKHKPEVIMVEIEHTTSTKEGLNDFIIDKGYILYTTISANSIYVDENYRELLI
ncbi:hypothetical protein [Butyrivibrio sp. JL13D10]|uniref:hypothetical protein n=1 Tax=Butyrivibrio sp. JL13D10 TaxID=3236815 RepID=UPI0038B6386F